MIHCKPSAWCWRRWMSKCRRTALNGSMHNVFEICFAGTDDLPHLADLLGELFALESDFKPDRDRQLRGMRLILAEPALGRLFVLRIDGRVAGMANALITVSTAEGARV